MAEETYAEITITGEEIEREQEAEKNKVSEKDKIVYHNATVKRLESGIRAAIKKQQKSMFFQGREHLEIENKEYWKLDILNEIYLKMKQNGVKFAFAPSIFGDVTVLLS